MIFSNVVDQHRFDTDPDLDPDPTFHFDADPDPCPTVPQVIHQLENYNFLLIFSQEWQFTLFYLL